MGPRRRAVAAPVRYFTLGLAKCRAQRDASTGAPRAFCSISGGLSIMRGKPNQP
jgi:hypothetical protein